MYLLKDSSMQFKSPPLAAQWFVEMNIYLWFISGNIMTIKLRGNILTKLKKANISPNIYVF